MLLQTSSADSLDNHFRSRMRTLSPTIKQTRSTPANVLILETGESNSNGAQQEIILSTSDTLPKVTSLGMVAILPKLTWQVPGEKIELKTGEEGLVPETD